MPYETNAGGETATATQPTDWRTFVTDDLKADPVVAGFVEKASEKDIPSLIKSYAHATKRLGSALSLPGKDAKPEELQGLRQRLYDAGIFERPPGNPEDYGIAKPETLPEGLAWNDELATKFATTLHKHGVPKAAAGDLLTLYTEAMTGVASALKTDREATLAALRQEHGDQFDERKELAARMIPAIFKTPDEVQWAESLGLGDHPGFLSLLMRLAPLAAQDSSFLAEVRRPGGQKSGEEVRAELAKIMTDPQHPQHAGWKRGDKAALAYVDELYKQAYGSGPVPVGEQVVLAKT